jgi:hypothetical protein
MNDAKVRRPAYPSGCCEEVAVVVKVAAIAIVAFAAFYLMTSPDHAAEIAKGAWHFVQTSARDVREFVDKLTS